MTGLVFALAMWFNGGKDPTSFDIGIAIGVIALCVIGVLSLIWLLIPDDAYMNASPYQMLLDIQDYDNDRYKIFLLKSNFTMTGFGAAGYKGDFYHLSELIAKNLKFSGTDKESVCKVAFAESNPHRYAQARVVDKFEGVLFYDRESDRWHFYRRQPTVRLKFYNKDGFVHVDVKIAVIGLRDPDMPPHANLDDLLALLFLNHNENYTVHFLSIDNNFKRGKLEDENDARKL